MDPKKVKADPAPMLRGDQYRRTHKASVVGILGAEAPDVFSKGSMFYNRDRWTARAVVSKMCEWAKKNPDCTPTLKDVREWVKAANAERVPKREIVIASTPDKLPLRVALALTGGAYHEAFHTKYSCRRPLTAKEVADIVLPRWARLKDWSKYHGALQQWSNIIEDIRIERRGREKYDGVYTKLADLQDFILSMEAKGKDNLRAHGGKPGAFSVIEGVFRDVGLGYNTERQTIVMTQYTQDNADAVKMVLDGPLSPMLREAIDLTDGDEMGCIRVAMDVIAVLGELAGRDQEDQQQKGQDGDGDPQPCPNCGAPANKLKVRPLSNGKGGKVKGKGTITCTACGWQQEVDIEEKPPQSQDNQSGNQDGPVMEGFDQEGQDSGDGDKGDKDDKQSGSSGGKGDKSDDEDGDADSGSSGDESGEGDDDSAGGGSSGGDEADADGAGGEGEGDDSDEEGDDAAGSSGDGEDEGDGEADADGEDGADADGSGNKGDKDDKGEQQGESGGEGEASEGNDADGGDGAGGHQDAGEDHAGNDWSDIANDACDGMESGEDSGLKDSNEALEEAFDAEQEREDRTVKSDEAPWRPYDQGLDKAEYVHPSHQGKAHDQQQADHLIKSVKAETSYLRARLRTIVRALEMTSTVHGVPKGKGLSSKFLVDTKATLLAKQQPEKAYFKTGTKIDMTMWCATVLDESGSMSGQLQDASRMLVALTEPFDALNCPTLSIGFRDGRGNHWYRNTPVEADEKRDDYHRTHGIRYDIFKAPHEKFKNVRWRFANTRANGSTPMSDGIQFALDLAAIAPQAHRFIFVITDGCPNYEHVPVINRQLRLAKEAGIHIVGVGLGHGADYVKTLFPDHIWSAKLSEIPKLLVAKLNELADIRGGRMKPSKVRG